jgi:hypothetical protein
VTSSIESESASSISSPRHFFDKHLRSSHEDGNENENDALLLSGKSKSKQQLAREKKEQKKEVEREQKNLKQQLKRSSSVAKSSKSSLTLRRCVDVALTVNRVTFPGGRDSLPLRAFGAENLKEKKKEQQPENLSYFLRYKRKNGSKVRYLYFLFYFITPFIVAIVFFFFFQFYASVSYA